MRTNAVYLRRLHRRSQFACADLGCVEPVASQQDTPVNGKHKESLCHSGNPQDLAPECEREVAQSTRSVLKRVLSFFQLRNSISPEHRKPSSPARPPKQPPSPRNRRKLNCPEGSARDKENIPPLPKAPTAVSLLRNFRQQELEESKQEQGPRPPLGVRPLSEFKQFAHPETQERPRQFSKLSVSVFLNARLCVCYRNSLSPYPVITFILVSLWNIIWLTTTTFLSRCVNLNLCIDHWKSWNHDRRSVSGLNRPVWSTVCLDRHACIPNR